RERTGSEEAHRHEGPQGREAGGVSNRSSGPPISEGGDGVIKKEVIQLGLAGSYEARYLRCDVCQRARTTSWLEKQESYQEATLRGWFVTPKKHICPSCCRDEDIRQQGTLWRTS